MTPQKADRRSGPARRDAEAATKVPKKSQQILQEALQARFGLTVSEASAYAALFVMGQLTPYEVSIYSNLPLGETEPALEALAAKKLVKVLPGVVKRYLAFAPYKGLAALVDEFHTQSSTALSELQTRQKQAGNEISGQLDNVALQLGKRLAKNYHGQEKTLRAAAATVRASLLDLTHAQRKLLTDFTDSHTNDFSSQTTALQKSLNQNVDDGIRQLQDAYSIVVNEPLKFMTAHRQTSQQWLDSSRDRLLGHLEAVRAQLQTHLQGATAALQETTETALKATRGDAATKVEATHQQLEKAAATLTTRIQAFGKKQRQSIDAWQKQQVQMVKQAVQALGQNQRESSNQTARALAQIRSDLDKTLNRESQRVAQDFERSTAEIVSIIDDWGEGATQIGDNLFLNLRTAVSERIQAFLELQKEIESTVSQWPPTALTFAQLATLKESLTKLTQGAARESGKLVKSAEKTIGAELKEASLGQLGEEETLLQSLADSLVAQQPTLVKNVEVMVGKVAKGIDAQSAALSKTADTSAKGLQDEVRQQVTLGQGFRQKGRQVIVEEATAVAGVLGAVGAKLRQFAETRIPAANQTVRELSASCTARIGDHGKALGKHVAVLEATLARYVNETSQSLQPKLERLQGLVSQYAKDVETTATRLRGEQAAEIQRSQADYRSTWEKQGAKRDKQVAQTLRAPLDQLKKSQRDLLPPLQQALDETVIRHAQTALTDYRTTLTNEQATLHDHATTAFQTTLHKLIQQDLPALEQPIQETLFRHAQTALTDYRTTLTNEQATLHDHATTAFQTNLHKVIDQDLLAILTKHAVGGMQPLQDAIEQASAAVQDAVHQADSEAGQQIEASLGNLATAIQQYASANISNLAALNAAINKALDQEFNTLATFVFSFQERAKESLTRATQAVDQECQTLSEGIGTDVSGLSEGCLAQLSQARTMFETLGQELVSGVDTLVHNTEAKASDSDAALDSGLTAFQSAGDALVQDILKEVQLLVGQNQELSQKGQILIRQQVATVAEVVGTASDQLRQFAKNRIPQAKEAARQLGSAYLTTLNGYQTTFEKQLSGLESKVTEACDGYVSALQQELAQLQTAAATMVDHIGQTGQSLDTVLREQIEKSLATYLMTIEEQGTQLHEEVSNAFQATLGSFGKIQDNLLSVLGQDLQNGKTVVEDAVARAGSALEETIRGVGTQSETFGETLRGPLASTIEESTASTGEAFAATQAAINIAFDGLEESVGQTLTGFQNQITAHLTATAQSLNQETDKLENTIKADVASAASALAEGSTQIKDKLDQTGRDVVRRAGELMKSIRDIALAGVEERNRVTTLGVKQFAASVDRSISAQARQTAKQVFTNLKATRQVMKTEGQALAKDSENLLKQTSAATLTLVGAFAENAGPALSRVETGAAELQQTLTKLWDAITEHELSQIERTWRITTKRGVQNHLEDMIRRAHTTITLVYPSLEEAPLGQLVAMPPNCRIHLVTTLNHARNEEALRKLLARQNIRVWDAPKTEFYAGSRDGEEVLIAPISGEPREVVAVASDDSSYVALFNQSLGPRWISGAKEVVPRLPPQS